MKDIAHFLLNSTPNLDALRNQTVLITGASGLIGSRLTELLMELNRALNYNIQIILTGRNLERLKSRFSFLDDENIKYWELDLDNTITKYPYNQLPNFIVHAASAANPKYYQEKPVETMTGNFIGCLNLLKYFTNNDLANFLYVSSGEIYGNQINGSNEITENMYGYIDGLSTRSCYPISKRAAETLCVSWASEYNQKITIARPSHVFGPGFNHSDTRISADFFRLASDGKELVLKSSGTQIRSYTFVDDCVSGILTVLINGQNSEAYNITKTDNSITIKDFAKKIASFADVPCRVDLNENEIQKTMDLAILSDKKLRKLGWNPCYSIDQGISRTFANLQEG